MVDMGTRTNAIDVYGPPPSCGEAARDGWTRHFTVHHDGVTIPVSLGGRGRPLVLCPGLNSTQADLRELTEALRCDHQVVTFDLRGHGLASPAASRYSFDDFLSDLVAVMAEFDWPTPPVLVGYSLGADLAVHHAAERPESVAELVLIDGANPLPEPFITEADREEFRAMAERLATSAAEGSTHQVALTAEDIFDLCLEIDVVRSAILHRYRRIRRPIHMIMSNAIAGGGAEARAAWRNRLWRAGVERLVREFPEVSTSRLDADHRLVFTHAPDIADIIRTLPRPAGGTTS
ncbi:alpha/beta hydrolase family protein [Streptomyces sp. HD1123-B1]|uniref:alpha/beta fold hydrolase n=1 Tax=Streptomyces huangiella TaxID=3228804 RepID=UPI003D7D071A